MAKAKIIGTGIYAPGEPIDNTQLLELSGLDLDKERVERIENKLGIKKRHIAKLRGISESTADFATNAALEAIKDADIDPREIKLFVVGSDTPEYISPSTAILVQGRIQKSLELVGSFDINSSCASFVIAYDTASRIIATDPAIKYAVVIGVYNMPAFINDKDAFSIPIFADGAGAIVLERVEDDDPSGYISGQLITDGTQWNFLGIYAGGAKKPISHKLLESGEYGLELLQKLPPDRNIKLWPPIVKALLKKAEMKLDDVDHLIFTQINKFVIEEVMKILKLPMEKTTCIMDRYGYTGSGCVPMAFHTAVKEGTVRKGDTIVFVASGAGFAVGSNIFVL